MLLLFQRSVCNIIVPNKEIKYRFFNVRRENVGAKAFNNYLIITITLLIEKMNR